MRFVLSLSVVVTLLAFYAPSSSAIEVRSTSAQYSPIVQQIVVQDLLPAVEHLKGRQQRRIDSIVITVVEHSRSFGMAIAIEDNPPQILVNNHFLRGLDRYIEAYLIAEALGQPYRVEEYFSDYFWRYHPDFIGEKPLSPSETFPVEGLDLVGIQFKKESFLKSVITDVLLHEIGHHAKQAFYSFRASPSVREIHEELADDWARDIARTMPGSEGSLGRLISIGYIFEQERWAVLAKDHYYPRMLHSVVRQIPFLCRGELIYEKERFCDQLEGNIQEYFSRGIEEAYLGRIENGEHFASFPMAQIQMAKSNFVDACNYFNESLIYGQVSRAAIYVGWCYQKGYLEHSPPDAQVLALLNSRGGNGYGFNDRREIAYSLLAKVDP